VKLKISFRWSRCKRWPWSKPWHPRVAFLGGSLAGEDYEAPICDTPPKKGVTKWLVCKKFVVCERCGDVQMVDPEDGRRHIRLEWTP